MGRCCAQACATAATAVSRTRKRRVTTVPATCLRRDPTPETEVTGTHRHRGPAARARRKLAEPGEQDRANRSPTWAAEAAPEWTRRVDDPTEEAEAPRRVVMVARRTTTQIPPQVIDPTRGVMHR